MIDPQHLQQYPYCGSMDYIGNKPASSARVVNSEIPKEVYRWIVLQISLKNKVHKKTSTGTIIYIYGQTKVIQYNHNQSFI